MLYNSKLSCSYFSTKAPILKFKKMSQISFCDLQWALYYNGGTYVLESAKLYENYAMAADLAYSYQLSFFVWTLIYIFKINFMLMDSAVY